MIEDNSRLNISNNKILLAVFITAFIDMLGIGIIIPVIPTLFFNEESIFYAFFDTNEQRSILYGLLLASYPIMQFFGSPILGALSDRFGRKPILSISLFGTFIGYLLFAYGVLTGRIWLLFIGRLLPGFTGGNISIVMSSIADISTKEAKTRNFGLISMAFGLGFILGPAIGGILADPMVVSWFSYDTPFWMTAIMTLFNILLLQFIFRETLSERRSTEINFFTGFVNISKAFSNIKLRSIFGVVILLSLGFSFFTQFFSVYLIERFSYSVNEIGLLYGWIGIWLVLTQGGIVRYLSFKYDSEFLLKYSLFFIGVFVLLLLVPSEAHWFYYINPLIAIAQGITSPNITNVISNLGKDDEQGEILGIHQSMQSLGRALPPIDRWVYFGY